MHKAGGWIALISGFFSIGATFVGAFFIALAPAIDAKVDIKTGPAWFLGGLFTAALVIILSVVILNTRSRVPGVLLLLYSVAAILFNFTDGFVVVCLVFTILGGLFALAK